MISLRFRCVLMALFAVLPSWAQAATPEAEAEARLQRCLAKVEEAPDYAFSDAQAWAKKGGGERAALCEASALFKKGDNIQAADAFLALARKIEARDALHAAALIARAGLAYMRANATALAETNFAKALKLAPKDPEIWIDRATARAAVEHYWDAIADLNQALALAPENVQALKARGQTWTQLGLESKAKADFQKAYIVENNGKVEFSENGKTPPASPPKAP